MRHALRLCLLVLPLLWAACNRGEEPAPQAPSPADAPQGETEDLRTLRVEFRAAMDEVDAELSALSDRVEDRVEEAEDEAEDPEGAIDSDAGSDLAERFAEHQQERDALWQDLDELRAGEVGALSRARQSLSNRLINLERDLDVTRLLLADTPRAFQEEAQAQFAVADTSLQALEALLVTAPEELREQYERGRVRLLREERQRYGEEVEAIGRASAEAFAERREDLASDVARVRADARGYLLSLEREIERARTDPSPPAEPPAS